MARTPAHVPLQTASKADLIAKYDDLAQSVTSLNAGVTMQWTSSSNFTGIIKQYPRVSGFILAQKPTFVRVIGEAPVIGTTIFDMVSDGETFSVYVPSKNQFLTGPADLQKPSEKAVENLRPQHLLQAIFWQPIPATDVVLLEQSPDNSNDYILTVASQGAANGPASGANWNIARKIWFERVGMTMARIQIYGSDGQVESDIHYSHWQLYGTVRYPQQITLDRPVEGYTLAITVTKLTPNATIDASKFVLKQPTGSQLIHVDEGSGTQQH